MDLGTLELQLERQGGEMDSEEAEGLRKRVAAAGSNVASRPPERAASGQDATDLEPPAMQEPKPRPTPPGPRLVTWFPYSLEGAWLTWKVEINGPWAILLLVTIVSRFWRIDFPTGVVFDEVHFGKFASYYLTQTYFFDVHPPLGKMAFAAVGYFTGFDGSFLFTNIGIAFPPDVPYVFMRSLSAIAGTLLIPCVYQIMIELGYSHRAALLAGIFTLLDNSLVIQSRVIMLDSFLILFTYTSILCYLRFYHQRHRPFTNAWHSWLTLTGVSLGCLVGVKYTGLIGLGCVGLLNICDLWQLLGDTTLDLAELLLHTLLRGVYLLGIPMMINLALFYLHFAILTQSGPGDAFMSRTFRNTLQGGSQADAINVPDPPANATLMRYGSQLSLRSSDLSCWLHSHSHLYPLKYPDNRGSSYQQQVTCYEFKDVNNMWYIRRPGEPNDTSVGDDHSLVRNKDEVELIHVGTSKLLNSHDVAAPLTATHQEVAGYINYSAQFVPNLHWRMEVRGLPDGQPVYWEPGKLKLSLIHVNSKQALSSTGKRLPEWGFDQYEVVTDKEVGSSHAVWTVDELKPPSGLSSNITEEDWKEIMRLKEAFAESRRTQSTQAADNSTMSFWGKYFELQYHMVTAHGNLGDHQFGAKPPSWPLMGKTLPYWLDEHSNAQVTLIGNPLLWWVSSAAIFIFVLLTGFYLLRRKRHVLDLSQLEYQKWWTGGGVLLVGWVAHYLPYFLLSRVLFLHHYLPALPFKFMLLAAVCEHGYTWLRGWPKAIHLLYHLALGSVCLLFFVSFVLFAPFTYGFPALSRDGIDWRRWVSSWDLLKR